MDRRSACIDVPQWLQNGLSSVAGKLADSILT